MKITDKDRLDFLENSNFALYARGLGQEHPQYLDANKEVKRFMDKATVWARYKNVPEDERLWMGDSIREAIDEAIKYKNKI